MAHFRISALTAALIVCAPTVAQANEASHSIEIPRRALERAEGGAAKLEMIDGLAKKACRSVTTTGRARTIAARNTCRRDLVKRAVQRLDDPQLSATYLGVDRRFAAN